jgi:hypothetical protein
VLTGPSDRQLGLLAGLQIWWDQFLGVSLVFVVIHDSVDSRREVVLLEPGCWSGGGGFAVLLRLYRCDEIDLGLRQQGDVPRTTCHNDIYLSACSRPVHRLRKPRWRWCFLGSCNGGGSMSLPTFVSAALELGGGRSVRWLQEMLGIILYFSIS